MCCGIDVPILFSPGFSDKDLEDILGGGEYKPDKGEVRVTALSEPLSLITDVITW